MSQRMPKRRSSRTSASGPRPGGRRRPSAPGRVRTAKPRPTESGPHPAGQRLQKVLAAAGAGSRRQCEELITSGRVEVDRRVVKELGTRVDPDTQEIRLDGETLTPARAVYYAVNKPTGVVSTNWDPSGRPRVIDLVPSRGARLFPVGRLDLNSEGLILVTNDGEFSNRLTHPRYEVPKTYVVQVAGKPEPQTLEKICRGVHLSEGLARAEKAVIRSHHKNSTLLEMVLTEGQNREIRRLLAKMGHKVLRLVRTAIGPVKLGKLPPGGIRPLSREELDALRHGCRPTDRKP